jgi:hypothetical protein
MPVLATIPAKAWPFYVMALSLTHHTALFPPQFPWRLPVIHPKRPTATRNRPVRPSMIRTDGHVLVLSKSARSYHPSPLVCTGYSAPPPQPQQACPFGGYPQPSIYPNPPPQPYGYSAQPQPQQTMPPSYGYSSQPQPQQAMPQGYGYGPPPQPQETMQQGGKVRA